MAEFRYQAKTKEGYVVQGVVDAPTENLAVDILHGKGYVILSLEKSAAAFELDVSYYLSRPNKKDLVVFTRQLSTSIDADMPISEGLRTLAKQIEKASFQKIIAEVAEAVEGGSLLSAALAQYPNVFSDFYVKLVQSGEVTGKLHESLLYLADYVERSAAINSKIKSALAYPAFIIFALVSVSILMVTFVLPQLLQILKETGATDLPITTKILIWVTDFVNENLAILSLVSVLATVVGFYLLRTPEGKAWMDNFLIRIPGIGNIVRNLFLARIAESLSTLFKAGISILDSLRITADLSGNYVYRKIMLEAEEGVRSGGTISATLAKYNREFPPLFTSMLAIGERTGKMDFILGHISKFYKSESENSIEGIAQVIEPALILLLGIGVGGLVSSILLPIYNVVSSG